MHFSRVQIRFLVVILGCIFAVSVMRAAQSNVGKAPARTPAPVPAPTVDATVPFHVGETLTYDISWANAVSAGTATISVNGKPWVAGNRTAYDIVAEAKPGFMLRTLYPIYYRLETYLDSKLLLPIEATMYSEERNRKRTKTTRFVSPTNIEYEFKAASATRTTKTIERLSVDPLSLFYALRGMTFSPGQVVTFPLTESGTSYRISVRAVGYEQISTGAGKFRAMHLTPTIADASGKAITDRKLSLWISDDARHLPVRFESVLLVGSFVLNLSRVTG